MSEPHHIVIEGSDDVDHFVVTCVETGQRFWLQEAGSPVIAERFRSKRTDDLARYFMNGKDGCTRCPSSTRHILLGALKR